MNSSTRSYLRSLSDEFGESTNGIRIELNRLSKAGILELEPEGNTVMYKANDKHPLFSDISNMVKKYIGIDKIIEEILAKLGDIKLAFITGDYAEGRDSGIIDLVLVGNINQSYLIELIQKSETVIKRKIRYLILSVSEYESEFKNKSGHKILIF